MAIWYRDEPFPSRMDVLNQTVTCGTHRPGKFMGLTFTCSDVRVNGHRLAYGYYHGWAVGQLDQRCQETKGVHEFPQLCLYMLRTINMDSLAFKAVYVPNSTCSFINDTRKLMKKTSATDYQWVDFQPGWGWTETIQCMTGQNMLDA